jgi:hypothetical protein
VTLADARGWACWSVVYSVEPSSCAWLAAVACAYCHCATANGGTTVTVAAPTSKEEKDGASPMMMDKCEAVAAAAQVEQDQAQMALVEAKDDADAAVALLHDQREQQEQQANATAPTARTQRGKPSNGGAMPDAAGTGAGDRQAAPPLARASAAAHMSSRKQPTTEVQGQAQRGEGTGRNAPQRPNR